MAKRHRAKSHRKHHRRIGATGLTGALTKFGTIAAGAVVGTFVNAGIKKMFTTLPPWAAGVGTAAVGIAAPKFIRNPMVADLATGVMAAGALFALNESFISLPGIAGIGAVPKGLTYRATPKLQKSVSGRGNLSGKTGYDPGFMDKVISGQRDLMTVGALYDN